MHRLAFFRRAVWKLLAVMVFQSVLQARYHQLKWNLVRLCCGPLLYYVRCQF